MLSLTMDSCKALSCFYSKLNVSYRSEKLTYKQVSMYVLALRSIYVTVGLT